jgi:hypothetical protein
MDNLEGENICFERYLLLDLYRRYILAKKCHFKAKGHSDALRRQICI